jgi:ABC-type Fe3+-siderophore transport system permease subunit
MLRAVWTLALRTFVGSAIATGLFSAYAGGIAFLAIAALKPIFPNNVGLIGASRGRWTLGAQFPLPPGATVHGGYWIIPLSIVCGMGILVFAHTTTHHYLAAWRKRQRPGL